MLKMHSMERRFKEGSGCGRRGRCHSCEEYRLRPLSAEGFRTFAACDSGVRTRFTFAQSEQPERSGGRGELSPAGGGDKPDSIGTSLMRTATDFPKRRRQEDGMRGSTTTTKASGGKNGAGGSAVTRPAADEKVIRLAMGAMALGMLVGALLTNT